MYKFHEATDKLFFSDIVKEAKYDLAGLIEKEEKSYKHSINDIASWLLDEHRNFIFLTGPSASGKTTTAIFLGQQIMASGKKAFRISLDNFYKNREELPFWRDGSKNFETIKGLDLDCFHETVEKLFKEGHAKFPRFDFKTGTRMEGRTFDIEYDENTFIIFEGIHALNPIMYDFIDPEKLAKIYVSVHTDFIDDQKNRILRGQDFRLCRRLIRDFVARGTDPDFTLGMWEKVCLGEEKYIRPYRQNSDIAINSLHSYEMFVYKDFILEYEKAIVNPDHRVFLERILKLFQNCPSLSRDIIPPTSLLNEFLPKIEI